MMLIIALLVSFKKEVKVLFAMSHIRQVSAQEDVRKQEGAQ
jgi:hypothetical protein